jgi:hypothetical protein
MRKPHARDDREHMPVGAAISGSAENQAFHPIEGCRQMYPFYGFELVVPTDRADGGRFHNAAMLAFSQSFVSDSGHSLRL